MGAHVIECHRITDYALAGSTISEYFDDCSEDSTAFHIPDILNEFWIGVYEDGKYAGLVRVVAVTSVLYECHICILKGFRRVREYSVCAFGWMLRNIPNLAHLNCNFPEFKRGVKKLAEAIGFTVQGYSPNSFMKGNRLHNLVQ
jgi:hypothetical protein